MRRVRVVSSMAAVVLIALAGGGCSFQLGSMFEPTSQSSEARYTGSVVPVAASPGLTVPAETDAALRAAANELLSRNEPNVSLPWENPQTGARGTVTSISDAYIEAGVTCHDFLASYVRGGSEDWLQGEACREPQGHWEVRRLKPWTRS